ncbi:hypothetical protein LCGC14_2210430, partial [marine sediment metagenome]
MNWGRELRLAVEMVSVRIVAL